MVMTTLSPNGENRGLQQENQHPLQDAVQVIERESLWDSGRYQPVSEIGVGAYGVVFKAKDRKSDEGYVAMKCLRVENTEQGMPLSMVREIGLLKQLELKEHPNVVRLLDVCLGRKTLHETQLVLVFEHVDQDLDMFLKNLPESRLESNQIKDIMRQLLLGIDFLHSMRVIHRDLKPQNILITKSGHIKIADFGLARIYSFNMALTAVVVTLWYRAPEVLLQDSYASPVDVWSVGCIFAELFTQRPLFRGSGDVNQLKKIFDFIGRPSENEWPSDVAIPISSFPPRKPLPPQHLVPRMDSIASDLFMKLLVFKPNGRAAPREALAHPYFETSAHLPEPPFLSTVVNNAMKCTQDISLSDDSTSSCYRRMPYARRISSSCSLPPLAESSAHSDPKQNFNIFTHGEGRNDDRRGTSRGPTPHSSITPGLEQVTTNDSSDSEVPHMQPSSSRFKNPGTPPPLLFRDVGPEHLMQGSSTKHDDESFFLTPPSDLASSSSSSCDAPSSSSNTSDESTDDEVESSSSTRKPLSSRTDLGDIIPVIRRTHKTTDEQSRMSWAADPYLLNSGLEKLEQDLDALRKKDSASHDDQDFQSGKHVISHPGNSSLSQFEQLRGGSDEIHRDFSSPEHNQINEEDLSTKDVR